MEQFQDLMLGFNKTILHGLKAFWNGRKNELQKMVTLNVFAMNTEHAAV